MYTYVHRTFARHSWHAAGIRHLRRCYSIGWLEDNYMLIYYIRIPFVVSSSHLIARLYQWCSLIHHPHYLPSVGQSYPFSITSHPRRDPDCPPIATLAIARLSWRIGNQFLNSSVWLWVSFKFFHVIHCQCWLKFFSREYNQEGWTLYYLFLEWANLK